MWGFDIVTGGAFVCSSFVFQISLLYLCPFLFVSGTPKSADKEDRKEGE